MRVEDERRFNHLRRISLDRNINTRRDGSQDLQESLASC
jgi:ribonuclease PH